MLKDTFVKFDKDYPYMGPRKKGATIPVRETEAQLKAWEAAGVAHETDKEGKKLSDAQKGVSNG